MGEGGVVTWVNQWENMLTSSSRVKMAVKALSRSCRARRPVKTGPTALHQPGPESGRPRAARPATSDS